MAWWEAHADNPKPDSLKAWEEANPSLGTILDPADMKSALPPVTPEAEYVTKRLNKFVSAATTWLPHGSWDKCAKPERVVSPDEPVIIAFDGSWTNDSTALILCTVENPHVVVLRSWERPIDAVSWVVPSQEVEDAILDASAKYKVQEIACDPYYWREQIARWADLGLPVVEWPSNSLARIVPATKEFYRAVVERRITHDGDKRLARHLANATIREDSRGARIVKRARGAKIDLAVAAIIGHDRAIAHKPAEVPITFIAFD
jgi:phage terminase large subunit-like protein